MVDCDYSGQKGMIIFQMAGVAAKAKTALAREFARSGNDLTSEQWLVLVFLKKKEVVYQQVLADELGKDRHTISRIVHRLEKKGLLERMFGENDARHFNVRLSDLGREMADRLETVASRMLSEIVSGLGVKELESVDKVLKLMSANTDKML